MNQLWPVAVILIVLCLWFCEPDKMKHDLKKYIGLYSSGNPILSAPSKILRVDSFPTYKWG